MNKETILGFIRHALTFGGGFIVAKDWLPADQLDVIIGSIITLIGAVWSVVDKKARA